MIKISRNCTFVLALGLLPLQLAKSQINPHKYVNLGKMGILHEKSLKILKELKHFSEYTSL